MIKKWLLVFIVCGVGIGAYAWWRGQSAPAASVANVVSLLSEPAAAGFARATVPNDIQFPRDYGAHPDYQTEWWYYTGNLETNSGREFGFQYTIFRRAINPLTDEPETESAWRTNQIYLVHFTISDIETGNFYHTERYARGAADLAGAQADPYRVWVEDWSIAAQEDGRVRLTADAGTHALALDLTQTLPPILHGDGGLSAKSLEPGNASYYYSQVQQQALGTVTIEGERYEVTGKAWKDHEYSTSVLSDGAVGWDWFSLQFDDGSALMLFQIRQPDGRIEPASSGTFINPDGSTVALKRDDWTLAMTDTWRSPDTAAQYPVAWQLAIPKIEMTIDGRAKMNNQELVLNSAAYWEGAVQFAGERAGEDVSAVGYIEMTGYAE